MNILDKVLPSGSRMRIAALLLLLPVYYVIARWGIETVGLRYAAVSLIWPASGFALAVALRFGVGVWPLIFLASVAAIWPSIAAKGEEAIAANVASALLIGASSALEPALATVLTRRLAGGAFLQRAGPFLLTVLVAWPLSAIAGTLLLVLGSVLGGLSTVNHWAGLMVTWYGMAIADLIGMMALAPPVWLWLCRPRLRMPARQALELAAYFAVGLLALSVREPVQPLYLVFAVHLAVAIRMPLPWTALAVALTSGTLLWQARLALDTSGSAPPPYEVFLTVLSFPLALTLATYLTALLWREVQQHRQRLEARVADRTRALEQANDRLQHLSRTDSLTGAWNRRYFEHRACRELERAGAHGSAVGFLLLDLDEFKRINDRYGHPAGDDILMEAVSRWIAELRPTDVLARVGGEEFAVLLPDCTEEYAREVAERLRVATAESPIIAEGVSVPVTVSVGVAVVEPGEEEGEDWSGKSLGAAMGMADEGLYRAKRAGRNRVAS